MTRIKINITADDIPAALRVLDAIRKGIHDRSGVSVHYVGNDDGNGECIVRGCSNSRTCPECHMAWTPEPGALSSTLCIDCYNAALACTPVEGLRREWRETEED